MYKPLRASVALISTLLLVGCGGSLTNLPAPPTEGVMQAPGSGAMAAEATLLRVQAVDATSEGNVGETETLPVMTTMAKDALSWARSQSTNATSERNTYFQAAFLTDGNLRSAWRPAANDENPMLTFNLGRCMNVSAMGIKWEGSGTIAVQVSKDGGEWRTIASNLSPEQTRLVTVGLTGAETCDKVRLIFQGDARKLFVCEVKFTGGECNTGGGGGAVPTPAPSTPPTATPVPGASPSATPTPRPSVVPSQQPTPRPTPSTMPVPDDGDDDTTHSWDTTADGAEGDDDDTTGTNDTTSRGTSGGDDDTNTGTNTATGDDDGDDTNTGTGADGDDDTNTGDDDGDDTNTGTRDD